MAGGLAGAVLTGGHTGAHQGHAGFGHGGAHVGEVEVDHTIGQDDVGNTLDGIEEHVVGFLQHGREGSLLGSEGQQTVIGNGDQAVHMLLELFQTFFGKATAAGPFKRERFGDDTHGQSAHLLGGLGHDRRGPRPRTTAHAGGHEDHVGIADGFPDGIDAFQGGLTTHGGVGTGPQALGELFAQLDLDRGVVAAQGLHIGIGADELHPLQTGSDHVLHGVAAATAYTDDLKLGIIAQRDVDIINNGL